MKLYMVEKVGINIQGTFGIYDSYKKSNDALEIARAEETDNYHSFNITVWELNKQTYEYEEEICIFHGDC